MKSYSPHFEYTLYSLHPLLGSSRLRIRQMRDEGTEPQREQATGSKVHSKAVAEMGGTLSPEPLPLQPVAFFCRMTFPLLTV